jgi:hypothetical protein
VEGGANKVYTVNCILNKDNKNANTGPCYITAESKHYVQSSILQKKRKQGVAYYQHVGQHCFAEIDCCFSNDPLD